MVTSFAVPLDNATATVASPYTAGGGTLTVSDATPFGTPSPTNWLRITAIRLSDNARVHLKVTGVSGNVLTIASTLDGYSAINLNSSDLIWVTTNKGTIGDIQTAINALETSSLSVGSSVSGGTANYILYVDGSGNLNDSSGLQYSSGHLGVGGTFDSEAGINISGTLVSTTSLNTNGVQTVNLTLRPHPGWSGVFQQAGGGTVDTSNGNIAGAIGFFSQEMHKSGSNSISTSTGLYINTSDVGTVNFGIITNILNTSHIGIMVRASSGQTANLTEWRNSSDSAMSYVTASGVFTGNGSGLTTLNASNLGSGTVPTARLGTGTANSGSFLRGDQAWNPLNVVNVTTTTASGTVTLTTASDTYQFIDPNGANRVVSLPSVSGGNVGLSFIIKNIATSGVYTVEIKDNGGTRVVNPLPYGLSAVVIWDSSNWQVL